jgi:hypothetical protein
MFCSRQTKSKPAELQSDCGLHCPCFTLGCTDETDQYLSCFTCPRVLVSCHRFCARARLSNILFRTNTLLVGIRCPSTLTQSAKPRSSTQHTGQKWLKMNAEYCWLLPKLPSHHCHCTPNRGTCFIFSELGISPRHLPWVNHRWLLPGLTNNNNIVHSPKPDLTTSGNYCLKTVLQLRPEITANYRSTCCQSHEAYSKSNKAGPRRVRLPSIQSRNMPVSQNLAAQPALPFCCTTHALKCKVEHVAHCIKADTHELPTTDEFLHDGKTLFQPIM